MTALWVFLAVLVVAMGYVRLAPSDPSNWHKADNVTKDADFGNGVTRVIEDGADTLAHLDAIIRATPRTTALWGSPEEGKITYVTRTRLMGFPDYTTVEAEGSSLKLYARARFGTSDLGVNRNRVQGWLSLLEKVKSGG